MGERWIKLGTYPPPPPFCPPLRFVTRRVYFIQNLPYTPKVWHMCSSMKKKKIMHIVKVIYSGSSKMLCMYMRLVCRLWFVWMVFYIVKNILYMVRGAGERGGHTHGFYSQRGPPPNPKRPNSLRMAIHFFKHLPTP